MIDELLQKAVHDKAAARTVADVRIGLCYTAVKLDNSSVGVGLTFRESLWQKQCACRGEPLAGSSAADLTGYITSADCIERAVGIATANALLNTPDADVVGGDTLECIKPAADDTVGMVGYFGPLVLQLQGTVKELRIFERKEARAPGVYPAEEAPEFLRSCSVAVITGTTLINRTMEPLLEASAGCRTVAVVGASTPIAPGIFAGYPVHLLSGVVVQDPAAVLRIVSEGGGMKIFKKHIRKVNAYPS
jgi:hypothetical protein